MSSQEAAATVTFEQPEDTWDEPGPSKMKRSKVVVRVPATTANLGPGFDSLGMAIDIWNEFTVERADKFELIAEGEGSDKIPVDIGPDGESKHLVIRGLRRAFEYAGEVPMPPLKVTTRNTVPICSGLGSSSSAIVGGLVAGLVLTGREMKVTRRQNSFSDLTHAVDPEELLNIANDIEGHPDNVAPAIYGGIQLSMVFQDDLDQTSEAHVMSRRIPHPAGLRLVAYVPSEAARLGVGLDKTEEMRSLLKPTIDRQDAVVNIQRTALLVDSLYRNDLSALRWATRDRLHQPIRGEKAYPHLNPMVEAALEAGAHGAFLSGAGPTVLAICSGQSGDIFAQRSTERQEGVVADAMKKALESLEPEDGKVWGQGHFYVVSPAERGAHVVAAEPKFSTTLATFGSLGGSL